MKEKIDLNKLLTIVIPVYNTDEYLGKCISSIVEQTYRHIEIMLIDDGSSDNSLSICYHWADKDERIRVFHKENGGLSDARNFGINHADGEFIMLLDSDDYYDADACQLISEAIVKGKDPDVIITNMKLVSEEDIQPSGHSVSNDDKVMDGKAYLKSEFKAGTMKMAAVLYVYKKSFLSQNTLLFKKGILHEDEEFIPRVLLKAEKVMPIAANFYNYCIRENSITNSKNMFQNVNDLYETLRGLDRLYDALDDIELKALAKESLLEKYLYMYDKAKVYEKQFQSIRNKDFVKGKAISNRNKFKVLLFKINSRLYCFVNKTSKTKRK